MKLLAKINKFLPSIKKSSDLNAFNNVLVVSNSGLGDTILSTPAIISLRRSYPNINITFLINKKMYPLFEGFEFIDGFIQYSSGLISQIRLIKEVKKKNIDTIFLFHSNGPEDIFFSVLSGATNILKMTYDPDHEFKKIFLNKCGSSLKHNIENKLDMVRLFGTDKIHTEMKVPAHFYSNFGYIKKQKNFKYIGLQLGAQDVYKMWPVDKFISLVDLINFRYSQIKFILFGSTELEFELSKKLINSVQKPNTVINICGKTDVNELPRAVNDLDFLITNDTGILHLAIALKKRTISLFGPTNYKEFGPYQDLDRHSVIQMDGRFVNNLPKKIRGQEGMEIIGVDEVFEKADELLRGKQ